MLERITTIAASPSYLENKLCSFRRAQSSTDVIQPNYGSARDGCNYRAIADNECSKDEPKVRRHPLVTGRDARRIDTDAYSDRSQHEENDDWGQESRSIWRRN